MQEGEGCPSSFCDETIVKSLKGRFVDYSHHEVIARRRND